MNGRARVVVVVVAGLLSLMSAGIAVGSEAENVFVGAWESQDPDGSHVRLQIGASGEWHLRDDGGMACQKNDYGFVPATASGEGTVGGDLGDAFDFGLFDVYCYPRDRQGRQFVGTFGHPDAGGEPGFSSAYWPEWGVMIDNFGVCWWRSGTGSIDDCPSW